MANKSAKSKAPRRRGRKGEKETEIPSKKETGEHSSLLIQLNEDAPTWYKVAADSPERNATCTAFQPAHLVEKYRAEADELYRQEVQLFTSKVKDKDMSWVQATMSKGTLKDRIAAMSVTVSTDPVHRFYAIDGLLQMAGCLSTQGAPNSRVAQLAGEALIDLFINTLLPHKRKLLTLRQRPLDLYENPGEDEKKTKRTLSPRILLLWRYEEMVREKYHMFIKKYFGYMLRDGNDMQKIPAVRSAAILLKAIPEGEATLLALIVNKLGDPARKVASAAGHALRVVLSQHPAMQVVIAREVQQLAHRPHLSERALYNCITFLNQLTLRKETEIMSTEQRLPSSLVQTYFRLFEVAVNEESKKKQAEDPVAMKGRILSALLTGVNRAHPYLAKSLGDLEEHVNSLYKVAHKAPPAACTQALLLLFHLTVGTALKGEDDSPRVLNDAEKSRQKRFYIALYSKLADAALVGSGKHLTMFFNLLYKAMKYDTDKNRVLAFSKRVMCTTLHCSSAVLSASLFLLNEISKYHPEILKCQEEVLEGEDAQREFDIREQDPSKAIKLITSGEKNSGSSNAALAPAWEMSLPKHHHHPTVRAFFANFGDIHYKGDPLRDFTLGPFLDKFAYRNPKSSQKIAGKFSRGESVAERRRGMEKKIETQFSLPFNDPSFINIQKVDAEDEFFHQYFVERAKRDEIKGITRTKKTSNDDEEMEDDYDDVQLDNFVDSPDGDASDFAKYEQMWDEDEEEEAFVDSLAQKVIEDSMDANEPGAGDLDDEDPDMEGWYDMYSEDDDNDEKDEDEEEEEEKDEENPFQRMLGDDSSDSDSDEEAPQLVDLGDDSEDSGESDEDDVANKAAKIAADEDDFMDDSDEDDNDSEDMEAFDEDAINPFADEDDDDMAWAGQNDQEQVEEESSEEEDKRKKKGKSKKKKKEMPTFASLEEYEEKINESWKQIKRAPAQADDENDEAQKPKKKKRRRKH